MPPTASVCILWAWAFLSLAGIGRAGRRAIGLRANRPDLILYDFWIGFVLTLGLLQLWNFFLPVDDRAAMLVTVIAAVGWTVTRGETSAPTTVLERLLLAIAIAIVAWWTARWSLGPIRNYDTGLYHLPMVRWIQEYALVPGLANLHGRLGFNSSSYLYTALLDAVPLGVRGARHANGLLLAVLLAHSLFAAIAIAKSRSGPRAADLFMLFLLGALLSQPTGNALSGMSNDFASIALALILARTFWEQIDAGNAQSELTGFVVILVAAAGIVVKQSLGILAATTVLASLLHAYWQRGRVPRSTIAGLAVALFIGALWIGRGVVLTGYPLFPTMALPVDTDWQTPPYVVLNTRYWIESWARAPGLHWIDVLENTKWLGPWFSRVSLDLQTEAASTLAGAALLAGIAVTWQRPPWNYGLFLLPTLSALVAWFVTAPDPRFATGQILTLQSGLWSMALACACAKRPRPLAIAATAAAVLLVGAFAARHSHIAPPPVASWRQVIPRPEYVQRRARGGLQVFQPTSGDQCWDTPLPCTPYFRPDLATRRGDLQSGFTLELAPACADWCESATVKPPLDIGAFDCFHHWRTPQLSGAIRAMGDIGHIGLHTPTPTHAALRLRPLSIEGADTASLEIVLNSRSLGSYWLRNGVETTIPLPLGPNFNSIELRLRAEKPAGATKQGVGVEYDVFEIVAAKAVG